MPYRHLSDQELENIKQRAEQLCRHAIRTAYVMGLEGETCHTPEEAATHFGISERELRGSVMHILHRCGLPYGPDRIIK